MVKKIINNQLLWDIIVNNWKDNELRQVFHNSILSANIIKIKKNNIDLAFLFIGRNRRNSRSLILKVNMAEISRDDLDKIISTIKYNTNYHEVIPDFNQIDKLKYKNLEKQNWNNFRFFFYEGLSFENSADDDDDDDDNDNFFYEIYNQLIETFQLDESKENEYEVIFDECLLTENFVFITERNGEIILILIGEKVKNHYAYLLVSVLENLLDEKYFYTININSKRELPNFRLTENKKENNKKSTK